MVKLCFIKLELDNKIVNEIYQKGEFIKNILLKENINFCNMDCTDVHMTICFLGKISKDKKNLEKIINIVNSFENNKLDELVFEKFELFPESKKNLIVAKYKMTPKLKKYLSDFQKKFEEYNNDKYDDFVPHITIGKIQNKNDKMIINLNEIPKLVQNIKVEKVCLHI